MCCVSHAISIQCYIVPPSYSIIMSSLISFSLLYFVIVLSRFAMVPSCGVVKKKKLVQVQLDDEMGYDIPLHEQHLHGSPSWNSSLHSWWTKSHTCWCFPCCATWIHNCFNSLWLFSSILCWQWEMLQLRSVGIILSSFLLELQTIVVTKDVMIPSASIIGVIRIPPSCCNYDSKWRN